MPRDRPRLWESFKRALGGSPRGEAPDAEVLPPLAGEGPPFLAPDPAPGSGEVRAQTDPIVQAPLPGAPEAAVAEAGGQRPTPPPPEAAASRSARLARGLASFSRDNADREKKFRHILNDDDAGGAKKR